MILLGSISWSHSQLGQSVNQLVIGILGTRVREVKLFMGPDTKELIV